MENTNRTTFNLIEEAENFLHEAKKTTAERSKKNIPSAPGLQMFLLFVRAGGRVPDHQVKGPITVQTLIGHIRMNSGANTYDLPRGTIVSFGASETHDVNASNDSIMLVTHALTTC